MFVVRLQEVQEVAMRVKLGGNLLSRCSNEETHVDKTGGPNQGISLITFQLG